MGIVMNDTVIFWEGRPVDEMSKEDLILVIRELAREKEAAIKREKERMLRAFDYLKE